MRRLIGAVALLCLLAGCGDDEGGTVGVREPTGAPRPVVFEPGQLVWVR